MDRNDEQFEDFLREFSPRRPRVLPDARTDGAAIFGAGMRRFAAAAVIAIAAGASLLFLGQNFREDLDGVIAKKQLNATGAPVARQDPARWILTQQALENPERLDATLAASRGSHLPRFDREGSTLKVLAKE
jgi:hypothetical protein